MRVCLLCAGPMPDPVRDDALYCSTNCKLKAQRKRKKERAQLVTNEQPCSFDLVAPLGDGPQLWLPFMGRGQGDGRQLSFEFKQDEQSGNKQRSDASAKKASPERNARGEQPQQQGWAARLLTRLRQLSNDDEGDIV